MSSRSEYASLIDKWKSKVLEKARYTCQECGAFGGPLDAHHIVSWVKSIHGRFDPDNGAALCPLCHGRKHGHLDGFIRHKKERSMSSVSVSEKRVVISLTQSQHRDLKILSAAKGQTIQHEVDAAIKIHLTELRRDPVVLRILEPELNAKISKIISAAKVNRSLR